MERAPRVDKSKALSDLATEVSEDATFEDMRTKVGIVATRWVEERPMIFQVGRRTRPMPTTPPTSGLGVKGRRCGKSVVLSLSLLRPSNSGDFPGRSCGTYRRRLLREQPRPLRDCPGDWSNGSRTRKLGSLVLGVGSYPAPKVGDLVSKAYWINLNPLGETRAEDIRDQHAIDGAAPSDSLQAHRDRTDQPGIHRADDGGGYVRARSCEIEPAATARGAVIRGA